MEADNYNQPTDSVPARVRVVVPDAQTQAPVIQWVPLDWVSVAIRAEDFE